MSSPAQAPAPKSVLRGHESQVHVAAFVRQNRRLATGDADGFVVLWDLTIRRPRAVWRAHTSAILGIASWGDDRIITHGRDNRLVVWKVTDDDEPALSTSLPLDKAVSSRPEPWVLHILNVNTMNFCAFACCPAGNDGELMVAVPNTLASESVDIYHLPSQTRMHTVHLTSQAREKTGMAMALALLWSDNALTVVVGHENGLVTVARLSPEGPWDVVYKTQAHSQPILSLDVSPNKDYFLTSGADALIIKHPIPVDAQSGESPGDLREARNTNEISRNVDKSESERSTSSRHGTLLLSSALAGEPRKTLSRDSRPIEVKTMPIKVANTKHSGQQSLRIRSDGKIFATAGWDTKVRVYSTKTMAELAVLKWHDLGCYATAFADVSSIGLDDGSTAPQAATGRDLSVKDKRIKHAKETHWLAAGSKDGKVSLWDIY